MHVLFYTPFFAHKGGIEKIIALLANHLVNNQLADVSILNEDPPSSLYYPLPSRVRIYCRNFTPYTEQAMNDLRDLVSHIDPTVVVVLGSSRALYKISRATVGLRYPIVLSEHNTDTQIVKSFRGSFDFFNSVRRMADLNHVLFDKFAESFPSDITHRVRVVHNPIFPSHYRCDPKTNESEPNIILHIGRYDLYQKQQDIIIESFASLAKKYPNWQVHLYGTDWRGGEKKLEGLIKKYQLEDKVYLKGPTENSEEVMSTAKILAFPSKFEGFGLVVGEAMSVGLPSIGYSQCDGVNELIINDKTGILVDGINDVVAFSKGLERMMQNEDERIVFSLNSIDAINRFSPDKFLDGWVSLISEAASMKGENVLLNLSEIEKDYMRLVVSGYLFDRTGTDRTRSENITFHAKSIGKIIFNNTPFYTPARRLYSGLRKIRKTLKNN
jgi:glycosyltransferase involved in cell wall biosynthesis